MIRGVTFALLLAGSIVTSIHAQTSVPNTDTTPSSPAPQQRMPTPAATGGIIDAGRQFNINDSE